MLYDRRFNWDILVATAPVPQRHQEKPTVKPTEKAEGDTRSQNDTEDENADTDVDEGNGMAETEWWLCDICHYNYAPSAAALEVHKHEEHNTKILFVLLAWLPQ